MLAFEYVLHFILQYFALNYFNWIRLILQNPGESGNKQLQFGKYK